MRYYTWKLELASDILWVMQNVHNRKIEHLRKKLSYFSRPKVCIISNITHNFLIPTCHLTPDEEYAHSV